MGDNRGNSRDSRFFGTVERGPRGRSGLPTLVARRSICRPLGGSARRSCRSTWSENTPSMPASSNSSRIRGSCASHPSAKRSKRWNSAISPPFQSEWCRFTASTPTAALAGGPPLGALGDVLQAAWSRTSFTSADRPRHEATTSSSGWHSHSVSSAPARPGHGDRPWVPRRVLHVEGRARTSRPARRRRAPRGVGMWAGSSAPRERAAICRRRRRGPITPSWSSTATPVRGEPHVALQTRCARAGGRARNASIVFSGAWARAPR